MTYRISTVKNKVFSHPNKDELHSGEGRFEHLQIPVFGNGVHKL